MKIFYMIYFVIGLLVTFSNGFSLIMKSKEKQEEIELTRTRLEIVSVNKITSIFLQVMTFISFCILLYSFKIFNKTDLGFLLWVLKIIDTLIVSSMVFYNDAINFIDFINKKIPKWYMIIEEILSYIFYIVGIVSLLMR